MGSATRIRPIAQGWRASTSRAEIARWRMAVFQSAPRRRQIDLAEHEIDHAVEEVVLVGHVVVQRHRLDPELVAEPAHAQRRDAVLIGKGDRGRSTRSRLKGLRGFVAGLVFGAIYFLPGQHS